MSALSAIPVPLQTTVLLVASNGFMTLAVFVSFAVMSMNEPFKLDHLWAALCLMGAVYFILRS